MRIVLIGFMGSGKTTVGRLLAERLAVPHIDTDPIIAERVDVPTVGEAFSRLGESAFRELESTILAESCRRDTGIISSGGGIIAVDANRGLLAGWHIIYLHTPFSVVEARLSSSEQQARPLLRNRDAAVALYDFRLPIYRTWATQEFSTVGRHPEEIAAEIATTLSLLCSPPPSLSPLSSSISASSKTR